MIDKHKIIDVSERSVYQLMEQYSETDKGISRAYRCTDKALTTQKISNVYILNKLSS